MSDTAEVGSIVAYLTLRREDWTAGVRDTERDARRLGSLNPRIRIETNSGEVIGQLALVHAAERRVGTEADKAKPFVMNLWASLAAVGPAAVPIGAVAGGALLGLLPVAAAVTLGLSGIKAEMKSGALQGTQYGQDIATVKGWLGQLKTTASSGLLNGLDTAVRQSQPLFGALNTDIGHTATQLGDIVGGAAPALLSILNQLAPLFDTIGNDVAAGAHELEHWAQSSNGISQFVAYVQAELPDVEHLLAGVVTLVGHLFEASAGPGAGLLHDINLLVDALDAIPVGVLQVAIPLAVSLYAALKTSQGVTAAVGGASAAIDKLGNVLGITGPKAAASAAQQQAASLSIQAAAAEEAAVFADSKAVEARAAAATAAQIAQATAGTGSVLEAGAADAALAADQFAAAMEGEALAARAAAAQIAGAVEAAAAASVQAGETASIGWAAMLGPIGGLVAGVGLLSTIMLTNAGDTNAASQAMGTYADSVKQSTNAIDAANVAQTLKNLKDQGALTTLDQLHAKNQALGITYADLAAAVNGSQAEFDKVNAALREAHNISLKTGANPFGIGNLSEVLAANRKGLQDQIAATKDYQKASAQTGTTLQEQTTEAAALYHVVGPGAVAAYQAAAEAARKNTDQTNAQTLAMQLEDNAAGLLNQALQTLAGQNLSVAQAQTSFGQSIQTALKSLHDNGTAIKGNSTAALANQQAIEGNVSSARQLALAVAKQTDSNDKAIDSYRKSKRELQDQLRAHGELTPAVQRYINKLYDFKGISEYLSQHPTKTDVKTEAAKAEIANLEARINAIKQGKVPGLKVDTSEANFEIAALRAEIDALHGKVLPIQVETPSKGGFSYLPGSTAPPGHADGGAINGAGSGKSDSIVARLSDGEHVWTADDVRKAGGQAAVYHLRALVQSGQLKFADGGGVYKVGSGYGFQGQYFSKLKDAQAAATQARQGNAAQAIYAGMPGSSQMNAMIAAAASLNTAAADSSATAKDVRDAAANLLTAARAAGLSHKALASVAADEKRLSADAAQRESVLRRLGTAPTAPTAYERLAAAQGQYTSDQAKYRDAALGFDITSVGTTASSSRKVGGATITTSTPNSLSVASIIAADKADVARIKEFDSLIHKLVAMGYDPDYVSQIAGKGPDAIETARALAAGSPKDVAELNRLESGKGGRKSLANDLGTFLAKQYDAAGVAAAQSFVNGLLSQEKTLTTEMLKLVDRIDSKIKLHHPTRHAGGSSHKKGRGGKQPVGGHSGAKGGKHPVEVHVHAAPGQSETTIARVAAAAVAWHVKR